MQSINVNIVPGDFPQILRYSQGDVGREFRINVVDFDIPTGATVTIVATKPSGFGFTAAGTVTDNVVSFVTTEDMTDEYGKFPAEVRITNGTTLLGTANFMFIGEKNPHPDGTVDGMQGTIIPELTLLVNEIRESNAKVESMTASAVALPSGSDPTAEYNSTDNNLEFGIPVVDLTNYATKEEVDEDITDLKSDLNNSVDFSNYNWELGTLSNGGVETNSTTRIRSYYIPVKEGTRIYLTGNSNCLVVNCFNSEYTFVSVTDWSIGNKYVVPSGVAYVRIIIRKSSSNPTIETSEITTQAERCYETVPLEKEVYYLPQIVDDLQEVVTKGETIDKNVAVTLINSKAINGNRAIINADTYYNISEIIPVKRGEKYKLSAYMNWNNFLYVFYNADGVAFGGVKSENVGTFTILTDEVIEIPEKAIGIRLGVYIDSTIGWSFKKVVPAVVADKLATSVTQKWANKKWVAIGDSLTENNATASKKYHALIAEETGIEVLNYGKSGTGYGKTYETNNNFCNRVLELANVDCDVITIFGSHMEELLTWKN